MSSACGNGVAERDQLRRSVVNVSFLRYHYYYYYYYYTTMNTNCFCTIDGREGNDRPSLSPIPVTYVFVYVYMFDRNFIINKKKYVSFNELITSVEEDRAYFCAICAVSVQKGLHFLLMIGIKRIHHWCRVETGKSQPEDPSFQCETKLRRVSHWNGGPEGWDFSVSLYTNGRFFFSHI